MSIRKDIKEELTRLLNDAVRSAQNPSCPEHRDAKNLFLGRQAYGTVTMGFLRYMLGKEAIMQAYDKAMPHADRKERELRYALA